MSDLGRGLPLLSGPPPAPAASADTCRKCNKEFNIIFARARTCNHCGYAYCHSCSDYQALMPRTGAETGYDAMHVCAFCIEFLTITAAGRTQLKAMPLAKLKKYINAYDIRADRAVEKDDLIDAILGARGPNGCLPRANENHYRTYSVPSRTQARSRGLFSRSSGSHSASAAPTPPPRPPTAPAHEFARPDLAPDHPPPPAPPRSSRPQQPPQPPPRQQYAPPPQPPPRPHSAYANAPPFPRPQYHQGAPQDYAHQWRQPGTPPVPPQHSRPAGPPPQNFYPRPAHAPPPPTAPRPRATSAAPPPTLSQLLTMDTDAIGALSIGTLKAVLFANHVHAGQILEKGDLVAKVCALVEDEKKERQRQREAEEREQLEMMRREEERREELRERALAAERERERAAAAAAQQQEDGSDGPEDGGATADGDGEDGMETDQKSTPPPSPPKSVPQAPKMQGSATSLERTGLCVICQDEEANIAIVDCGHMAMCRGCSDLIMSSSRECPLCRTRIVTEARLLRIFKA